MTTEQTLHAPDRTLADLLVPRTLGGSDTLRAALLVVGGAALTAAAAQLAVTLPWSPVPYTGQTAAVLLVGAALGLRLGALSMIVYVLAGSLGMPVYAEGAAGVSQLLGATGGYLAGFVVAAALVGRLAERGWDRSVPRAAALMALGNLAIYAIGVPVLMVMLEMGAAEAVTRGALYFLPWDAAKIVVASLALPLAWRLADPRRH